MEAYRYVRAEDQALPSTDPGPLDVAPLCGIWVNTNTDTRGIEKVLVRQSGGKLLVRVIAAGPAEAIDWGETEARAVYAKDATSKVGMAFEALYEFASVQSLLQANLSLGLLVVAGLNTFKDDSGRSNYFGREFYYRAK
ncbi:MAG TPA: hypothetical protein VFV34_11845 [Blastocatellia bacterium]|nr:hypothetical protein [Blastocatellia bacterium]